jgi:hypothetical protein
MRPTLSKHFWILALLALALSCPVAAPAGQAASDAGRTAIVLAVFGTADPGGTKAYAGLKAAAEAAFPGIPVRLAYTSAHARKAAGDPAARSLTPLPRHTSQHPVRCPAFRGAKRESRVIRERTRRREPRKRSAPKRATGRTLLGRPGPMG